MGKLTILKFEAPWCHSCKLQTQQLAELGLDSYTSIDAGNPEDLLRFRVRGLPTLLALDAEGNEVKRLSGTKTPKELEEFFREV
jgi:thiol-disulfide isomerase/thioredoxin